MLLSPAGRALALAGLLAVALAACGRRGPPEAPPSPSALRPQDQRDQGQTGKPSGQPGTGRQQGARGSAAPGSAAPGTATQTPDTIGGQPVVGQISTGGEDGYDVTPAGVGILRQLDSITSQPAQTDDPQRRRPFKIPKEPFILDPLL